MGNILTSRKPSNVSNRERISNLEDMVLQREIAMAVYVAVTGELDEGFMLQFLERLGGELQGPTETERSLHDKAVTLAHNMIAEGYVPTRLAIKPTVAPGSILDGGLTLDLGAGRSPSTPTEDK